MCGIAGGTLYNADTITEALRQIMHRGRDASKSIVSDGVWFGHNRLAIQDLSTAADQPLVKENISVVFNGELWRRSMDAYPSYTSDTALLADMYEAEGGDPVVWARGMDGMFAVAIHDHPRRRIVLARDWLGRIPLYYAIGRRGIAFASEAKSLTLPLRLSFAGNSYRQQSKGEVRLFPPGSVGVYSLVSGKFEIVPFRDFAQYKSSVSEVDSNDLGQGYYEEGIRTRLENAVTNELISDVPVCTILSGGVDSTIVTYILAKHVPNLRAYTVSMGKSNGKDDLAFARRAAEFIGVPLTEVIVEKDEIINRIEDGVWTVEDDRWMYVATTIVQSAMADAIGKDNYKVAFGGEGSDELFGSYDIVRRWNWRPQQYHNERIKLCRELHRGNLIRANKSMMHGTVELRTPFLDVELVDFCMRIPTRYRADQDGSGKVVKPLLREAFRGMISDELLMRPKVPFNKGAHVDFLTKYSGAVTSMFAELFHK